MVRCYNRETISGLIICHKSDWSFGEWKNFGQAERAVVDSVAACRREQRCMKN